MADEEPLKKKEFAVQHEDGSVSDIELWADILDEDEIADIERIKERREREAKA